MHVGEKNQIWKHRKIKIFLNLRKSEVLNATYDIPVSLIERKHIAVYISFNHLIYHP